MPTLNESAFPLFKSDMNKNVIFVFLFLSFALSATAQRGWEVGGWLGTSYYFGDLNTNFNLTHPGLAAGAVARFNFNDRLALKFGLNYGNIGADDANSSNAFERARNLNFRSVIYDGSVQFEFNFLPLIYGSPDAAFSPYLFGGFNAFYFNPQTKYHDTWYDLRPLGTEGQAKGEEYYTILGGYVYGIGLKWALGEAWAINMEISSRKLSTSYLDDVSGVYPNMNTLLHERGPLAVTLSDPSIPAADGSKLGIPGHQRGTTGQSDTYLFLEFGLVYYFGDLKCPIISGR